MLVEEPDYQWLLLDGSHCKVHSHSIRITEGTRHDSQEASGLIEGIRAGA